MIPTNRHPDTALSLDDLRDTLAKIQHLVERTPVDRWPDPLLRTMALGLLRRLVKLTDRAQKSMRDAELAEAQAVYGMVARKASELLELPEEDVYRAVIALCGDSADPALTDGLPRLDQEVADRLSRFLVQVGVVYEGHEDTRDTPRRLVRLTYGHGPGDLRESVIRQDLAYERLPDDVRTELLQGAGKVQFQLFPKRS